MRSYVINCAFNFNCRYHDQLVSLGARLPNMAHKPPNITIYWDDACDKGGLFGGKANISK